MATIEAVHSCGHGVIAGSVVAAALALADHRDQLAGKARRLRPARPTRSTPPAPSQRGGGKAHLGRDRPVERDGRRALLAPRVHRHRLARVPLDAPRARPPLRRARSLTGELEPPLRAAQAILAANALDVMVENVTLDGDVEDGTSLALQADLLRLRRHRGRARGPLQDSARDRPRRHLDVGRHLPRRPEQPGSHQRGQRGLRGGRPRLRAEPAAAAVRDRLRQHLPARPGGPDRRRPQRRLVVPHRRGRPAVRVGGRRRRRDDDRTRARAQRGSAHRARKLGPRTGHQRGHNLPGRTGSGPHVPGTCPPAGLVLRPVAPPPPALASRSVPKCPFSIRSTSTPPRSRASRRPSQPSAWPDATVREQPPLTPCAASTSTSKPARWSPSWARRALASRPSCTCSPVSTARPPASSWSPARTSPSSARRR